MGVLSWLFGEKEPEQTFSLEYPQDWQDNPVAEEADDPEDYGYDDLVADVQGAVEDMDFEPDVDAEADSEAEGESEGDADSDGDSDGDGEGGGGGEK